MNKLIALLLPPLLIALTAVALPTTAAEMQLLMIEQPGCGHCIKWDNEIAPTYPKTDEGKAAPLRRHQLQDPIPEDIQLTSKPVFTPTFILLADNVETGRIQGYPGEDFFWPLLARLITQAQPQ